MRGFFRSVVNATTKSLSKGATSDEKSETSSKRNSLKKARNKISGKVITNTMNLISLHSITGANVYFLFLY